MKCTKKELVSMLLENQKILKTFLPQICLCTCNSEVQEFTTTKCSFFTPNTSSTSNECLNCGKSEWEH